MTLLIFEFRVVNMKLCSITLSLLLQLVISKSENCWIDKNIIEKEGDFAYVSYSAIEESDDLIKICGNTAMIFSCKANNHRYKHYCSASSGHWDSEPGYKSCSDITTCSSLDDVNWRWHCNNLYFTGSVCHGICKHDPELEMTKSCSRSGDWDSDSLETEETCLKIAQKCLNGLQNIHHDTFCFVGENRTFEASIKSCSEIQGYRLFEPKNRLTNDQVYERGQEIFKSQRFWAWLGIHDQYKESK